jgi:hypothetical protein
MKDSGGTDLGFVFGVVRLFPLHKTCFGNSKDFFQKPSFALFSKALVGLAFRSLGP